MAHDLGYLQAWEKSMTFWIIFLLPKAQFWLRSLSSVQYNIFCSDICLSKLENNCQPATHNQSMLCKKICRKIKETTVYEKTTFINLISLSSEFTIDIYKLKKKKKQRMEGREPRPEEIFQPFFSIF